MRIATGGPRIECFTVRTLGLNAFAFSDLHGEGVIGVTEGALARLSRQQLQGVVAHEFGHILSGSYVTVTVSCLLFGIYSELGDRLEDAALATGGTRAAPFALVAIAAARLAVGAAARVVRDELGAESRARAPGGPRGGALHARSARALPRRCASSAGTPAAPATSPRAWLRCASATLEARTPLAAWQLARHAPAHRRARGRAAGAGQRLAGRLRAAGRHGGRDLRRARALGGGAGGRRRRRPADRRGDRAGAVLRAGRPRCVVAAPVRPSRRWRDGVPELRRRPRPGRLRGPARHRLRLLRRPAGVARRGEQDPGAPRGRLHATSSSGSPSCSPPAATSCAAPRVLARGRPGVHLIACPQCAKTMMRRHFSYEHAVEIDYCSICDLFWFEKDELEALQILAERQAG